MKKLLLLSVIACSLTAHAQFFQHYFYTTPQRNETFADGICTTVNYNGSSSSNFNIAWGTAFITSSTDTNDEVRFVKTNKNAATINTNTAASFKDNTAAGNSWYNSSGLGICEIARTGNAGGYVGVGSVSNNTKTGAALPGGSDGLFTKVSNSGVFSSNYRYDFTGGNDVFTSVVRSKIDTNRFYICGYSEKPTYSDVIVMAVKSTGAIIWSYTYHLANTNNNVYAKGFGIDEVTGTGKVVVVGSFNDPLDPQLSDGFAMMVNKVGAVLWVKRHNLVTSTDVYRNIVGTQTPNIIAICGYSDYNPGGPLYNDVWLTLIDTLGNLIPAYPSAKFRHRDAAGISYPSKGWDLREINTVVFVTGPVYKADTVLGLYTIYSTSPLGGSHEPTQYRSQKFDNAYGIDRTYNSTDNLFRLFTGIDDVLTIGTSSSYITGTNIYSNTCGFCFANLPYSFTVPINTPNVTATKQAAGGKIALAYKKRNYNHTSICSASTACAPRNQSGAIDETEEMENGNDSFSIYPNPVSDQLRIRFNNDSNVNCKIELCDVTGRIVYAAEVANGDESDYLINTSNLPSGLYLVRVNQNRTISSKKFIKQ